MCLMEDEDGLPKIKKMRITSEDHKYISESLIKLVRSLIIDLMRLIWSYFLVCRHSIQPTHSLPLMHKRYVKLLSFM